MSVAQSLSQTYKIGVEMPCSGCAGAITRVLGKLEGLESFNVSLENQIATVVTRDDSVTFDAVLKTIQKTGKKVVSGEANGKSMSIAVEPEKTE
ncbi:Copper transport protein ATX1 [Erysiphe neolycopersici]|uniref:Copper transport protein ATX1 n=1 Tax=Erysiphe neolycopersici TaxID=212602 RepID=A0A420HM93_9PEZI|nr:Copper transport protein ATX1 [Erysiphe neolycopersici]